MMRSLFSAVSGLKAHQQRMDVIGNNIANVNTPGFKKSQTTFQDMLSQMIRGASRQVEGGRGGTNPMQVGLGVTIGAINTVMTAGSPQDTGKNTDLAIEGEGFFVVSDGSRSYYTRAGAFDFDSDGYLIDANGMHVMGWLADDKGNLNTDPANIVPVKIDLNSTAPPHSTTEFKFSGNLDANTASNSSITVTQAVYDSRGDKHIVVFTFTKDSIDPNKWLVDCTVDKNPATISYDNTSQPSPCLTFTLNNGTLTPSTNIMNITFDPNNGTGQVSFIPDFSQMTQFSGETTITASQDGYPAGSLQSVSFDTTGTLSGVFSNGITQPLAQVALASFNNPGGLVKEGNTLFAVSSNSGDANIGSAGMGGLGSIRPGSLEMSNVDLAQEFTDMIVTQRGFQANSRVITASDEMLQDLVNLKR